MNVEAAAQRSASRPRQHRPDRGQPQGRTSSRALTLTLAPFQHAQTPTGNPNKNGHTRRLTGRAPSGMTEPGRKLPILGSWRREGDRRDTAADARHHRELVALANQE